ncbi:RNA polymerase sigma factor, partial [Bacteroides ovatus]
LKGLTGRQKEIIYLRFVHEMSFEEISEIMEINIQSARNLLTRSMEKLRKEVSSTTILFFIYMISI